MTYTIEKTIDDMKKSDQVGLIQIVKLSRKHTMPDYSNNEFVDVDTFRFESGWIQLSPDTRVEITRLVASCVEEHDHGVYYQAPRQMELWEVMFAIGEVNTDAPDPHAPPTDNTKGGFV